MHQIKNHSIQVIMIKKTRLICSLKKIASGMHLDDSWRSITKTTRHVSTV